MANHSTPTQNEDFTKNAVEAAIRIGLVVLWVGWCFLILRPFVIPIIWGLIIAVAIYPVYGSLRTLLKNSPRVSAILVTVGLLVILVWPAVLLGGILVENAQMVVNHLRNETFKVPPPPHDLETWPLIGEPLANIWNLASVNIQAALAQLEPQIRMLASWLLSMLTGTGLAILQFFVAVVIAGVLLANSTPGYQLAHSIGRRIAGERGEELATLAEATVRSVARGVLGVALIQSLFAGLGFFIAGIPAAGFWAFLCLILGIVQIGVGPIMLPMVIYVFSTHDTLTSALFLIWSIFVSLIDNILKPIFLGRGLDVPMVVIFMGAIGGMLLSGIIGLFIGAVVLTLGYKLFLAWLDVDQSTDKDKTNT
ncbi:MAG: AI-2E family transporter [Nitrospirales bacterium]|nr:AI-2E family transporter [Nitrospira sp.]MDR4461899.1 AI-2E family transporter [Nitrospirales bacterium]MDR4483892.1 AI-2E family transporter [Nitrospirales bacterium]